MSNVPQVIAVDDFGFKIAAGEGHDIGLFVKAVTATRRGACTATATATRGLGANALEGKLLRSGQRPFHHGCGGALALVVGQRGDFALGIGAQDLDGWKSLD